MAQETAKKIEIRPEAAGTTNKLEKFKDAGPAKRPALAADEQARIENLFVELLKGKRTGELAEEIAKLEKAGIAIAPIMQNVANSMGWIR